MGPGPATGAAPSSPALRIASAMAAPDTSCVPSCFRTMPASGLCDASATAMALGAMLSATAAAPVDTRVADFRRAIRLVLRLKVILLMDREGE